MAKKRLPANFAAAIRALVLWFGEQTVPSVIIGGIAASLLGRPRVTRDVDAVILLDESKWPDFVASGRKHGFEPRVADHLEFAARNRVLLLRHSPSEIDIDISLGALPFEYEMVAAGSTMSLGSFSVRLPRPEDLIVMKALARRERDIADIEGLLDTNPKLDLPRVRGLVAEFAAALEEPAILADFERILQRRRGPE